MARSLKVGQKYYTYGKDTQPFKIVSISKDSVKTNRGTFISKERLTGSKYYGYLGHR
jgi:hypothetical protein